MAMQVFLTVAFSSRQVLRAAKMKKGQICKTKRDKRVDRRDYRDRKELSPSHSAIWGNEVSSRNRKYRHCSIYNARTVAWNGDGTH